jgi:hypothetical protein
MTFKFILVGAAALAVAATSAPPSLADTALVVGSGWQYDQIDALSTPSEGSNVTFTVAAGSADIFRLSDAFNPGDVYTVSWDGGADTASSVFVTYSDFSTNDTGPFGSTFAPAWLTSSYSHLLLDFGPGTYSLSVEGNCAGGCPAGFGYRLDSDVPEPATWALMLAGFGGLGAALRSRRRMAIA